MLPQWREAMKELARCANIYVKRPGGSPKRCATRLSGLGMPVAGHGLADRLQPPTSEELVALWQPEIRFVIETFGVDRCFFASNFPVDKARAWPWKRLESSS